MEPDRNNAVVHRKVAQKQCCCCNVTPLPKKSVPIAIFFRFMKFGVPHINNYKRLCNQFWLEVNPTKGFQLAPKQLSALNGFVSNKGFNWAPVTQSLILGHIGFTIFNHNKGQPSSEV